MKYAVGTFWKLKKGVFGRDAKGNRVYIPRGTEVEITKNHGKDSHHDAIVTVRTVSLEEATVKGKNLK